MKLQDLYPLLDESVFIYVFLDEDRYGDAIASYDGRNSIPNEYNECDIAHISPAVSCRSLDVFITHDSFIKAEKYKKANERDQWLFGTDYDPALYSGGIRYFELTSVALEEAISLGFISPEQTHNDSPTVRELLAFAKKSEWDWSFEGFVVSPAREDTTKMSITAIYANDTEFTVEDVCKFAEAFRYADEFDVGPYSARAWWD